MKKVLIMITAVVAGFVVFSYNTTQGHTNPSGAPAQAAGAPNDGGIATGTCGKSSCHNVTATPQADMITSNIPVSGYIPGQTYTITGTITVANKVKFGFQMTPQNDAGQLQGQIVITNTTDTKIVSTKYVTHKTAGTGGQGTRTWSFDWVAPAAGTGDVTFYGAFMAANNNGSDSGDLVFASNLTVTEGTVGVNDMEADKPEVIVFPNPANGAFQVAVSGAKSAISTKVFNAEGRLVYSNVYNNTNTAKQVIDVNAGAKLSAGLYFVSVEAEGISKIVKLVVQ
ncbi:MAG: T9SS type A sorting domain-containing protein [Sphingobacteriales bacterium JAD_PAG50586_3]|nr:MAG: T9SS type A sorting domain-containing protein [Sphingobacteriales bacterium JAD_PAG50586_3]